MKKILLATTGLVGAALIASAASAEAPKVTLGGVSIVTGGYTSDDRDANLNSLGMHNFNVVTVKADGKTDAGLGYGAQIDLQADLSDNPVAGSNTNANTTFTYLEGAWGRTELGSNKSVASTMRVDGGSVAAATGGINGFWAYYASLPTNTSNNNVGFLTGSKLVREAGALDQTVNLYADNDTKVSYYTPVYSGFQAGVSFTPNAGDRGQTMGRADNNDFSNIWDLGVSYTAQLDNSWSYTGSATYETASSDLAGVEDINAWNVGAKVGYQAFSVAASYGDWDDSGRAIGSGLDSSYWTLGTAYNAGPVDLSATYINSTREVSATTENDFSNIVLGADYKLAPGLTPFAEVSFYDFNEPLAAGLDNNGSTVVLGTQVAF